MTLTTSRPSLRAFPLYVVCLLVAGCASTASESTPELDPTAGMSGMSLYVAGENGLSTMTGSPAEGRIIQPNVTFGGLYVPAASSHDVALTLQSGASWQLALLSTDGSLRTVFENEGKTDYSVAWSSDGILAFGYSSARGQGIRIVGSDGVVKDVGCSASSRALGWASADRLVVGNEDNNYVVATKDCTTISRVDARKMHEMAFNPTHPTVAYVLRELAYDRKARQYVPDSSLYVAGVDGSNPSLIVGDRYKPHRPSWSPDGMEIAFDARIPDQPKRRLISIYDADGGSAAFLNPSALNTSVSEWDAHWSPSGTNIAYLQKTGSDLPTVTVRPMNGSFVTAVGESGERFARWIDDSLLVVSNGKRERIVSVDGKTSVDGPEGATILWGN